MRIFIAVMVALGAGALETGCAHDTGYGALQTSWDQATPSSTPSGGAPPSSVAKGPPSAISTTSAAEDSQKKLTAAEVATTVKSAQECAKLAREYFSKDPRAGETLLAACVKRDDFIDLDAVLQGPWLNDMRTSEPLQLLVAQVIAHRGGFVESDTRSCRRAGLLIYDANAALKAGGKAVGRLVLVRGSVERVSVEKWGKGKSNVASIQESSWADEDTNADESASSGNIPARDAIEDTGRTIFARVESKDPRFARDHSMVFAMRLEGQRKMRAGDDGDDVQTLIGVNVAFFDAASRIRQ